MRNDARTSAATFGLTRRSFIVATLVGACAAGMLAGCSSQDEGSQEDAQAAPENAASAEQGAEGEGASDSAGNDLGLITANTLTVGSDCDYPPFIWMDGEQPCGFEYDLLTEICDRMGLTLNYLAPQKFDTIVPSIVVGGKMDIGVSSITITDDRIKEIDFCDPYCDSNQSITVLKTSGYESRDDLDGKTVAVHSGTTGEAWAKENLDATIVPYDDQSSAFAALAAGKADAFCEDLPIAQYMVANSYPECEVIEEIPTGEQYAFAISYDNPELRDALNEALADIKDDGTYDTLYAKYFGE